MEIKSKIKQFILVFIRNLYIRRAKPNFVVSAPPIQSSPSSIYFLKIWRPVIILLTVGILLPHIVGVAHTDRCVSVHGSLLSNTNLIKTSLYKRKLGVVIRIFGHLIPDRHLHGHCSVGFSPLA